MKNPSFRNSPNKPFDLELDDLLHPAGAFSHPRDVVSDPDLTSTRSEQFLLLGRWMLAQWKRFRLYAIPQVAPGRYRSTTFSKPYAPSTRLPSSRQSTRYGRDAKPGGARSRISEHAAVIRMAIPVTVSCTKRHSVSAFNRRFTRGQSYDFRLSRPV